MVFEIVKGVVSRGDRPEIKSDMDEKFVDILKSTWYADPKKRPTMQKLREDIEDYYNTIKSKVKPPTPSVSFKRKGSHSSSMIGNIKKTLSRNPSYTG